MNHQQNSNEKQHSLLLNILLIFALCLVVLLLVDLIRYLIISPDNEEALANFLWEFIPAAVLLLAAAAAIIVLYRKEVLLPSRKAEKQIGAMISERENGKEFASGSDFGELTRIEEALCAMNLELDGFLTRRDSDTKVRADREAEYAVSRLIQSANVPAMKSDVQLEYSVSASLQTSSSAGGDYCDFFSSGRGQVCFVIGDIWGNGVSAALLQVRIKDLVRESVTGLVSLSDSMRRINAELCAEPETIPVTLFIGVFYPMTGGFRFCNAGHLAPVVVSDHEETLPVKSGVPLGIYTDALFEEESTELKPGCTVVFYTDGITSAYRAQKGFYGLNRFSSAVRKAWESSLGAEYIVKSVQNDLNVFLDGAENTDDAAILALYYPNGLQRVFRPQTSELETMRDLMLAWLKNDTRKNKIYLACEEIFTNIVNHANASYIQLICQKEGNNIVIRFMDDGIPFNPLPAQSEGKQFYDYGGGGMGLAIIRQIAGEVFYRTADKKNIFTVRFPSYQGLS